MEENGDLMEENGDDSAVKNMKNWGQTEKIWWKRVIDQET